MNEILVVSGIGVLAAAVAALVLIRSKDFVARAASPSRPTPAGEPEPAYEPR